MIMMLEARSMKATLYPDRSLSTRPCWLQMFKYEVVDLAFPVEYSIDVVALELLDCHNADWKYKHSRHGSNNFIDGWAQLCLSLSVTRDA